MKIQSSFLIILSLSLMMSNNLSYADELDNKENIQSLEIENSDNIDTLDNYTLLSYIEEIKNSPQYLSSNSEIKLLYDNAIDFNSRALKKDNKEWLEFSYNNLKGDIKIIEELANDNKDISNINLHSPFYTDSSYKIAYLKLDKEKQDILDKLKSDKSKQSFLTIAEVDNSGKFALPVFFSDWLYPFMKDKDLDGTVGESSAEQEAFTRDKDLLEAYRNTSLEKRYELKQGLYNKEKVISKDQLLNADNNLTEVDSQNPYNTRDDDKIPDINPNNEEDFSKNELDDSISENNINDISKDNKIEENNTDKYKYSSVFYIKNRTKDLYVALTDDQREDLDNMNTDGDEYLSIDELEKYGKYALPIKDGIDWLYPFMFDKNEDGVIDDSDRNNKAKQEYDNSYNDNYQKNNVNQKSSETKSISNNYESSFYKNNKTRNAYLNLPDEKKELLDKMNTDGNYPLTIDEVLASGLFTLPISENDWVYPFMIDKNNDGLIGEDYYYFKENTIPQNSTSYPKITSNSYPSTQKVSSMKSTPNIQANKNVKTGIKKLKLPLVLLISSSFAYSITKKYH